MASFTVNKKQGLIDVCLQIYGTTQQLNKLANDNGLEIDSDINAGDVLQYDPVFVNNEVKEQIEKNTINIVNNG